MDKVRVRKIGLSLASAAAKGDEKAVAKWATKALIAVNVDPTDDEEPVAPHVAAIPFGSVGDDMYNPSAETPGTPQYEALANGDAEYMPAHFGQSGVWIPAFTPNTARAWWAEWFSNPFDLRLVDPGALPGSLVLTAEQGKRAVAINKTTLRVPPDECAGYPLPFNPNLYEGSSTLEGIRAMQASGNPSYPPFPAGVVFPKKGV